MAYDLAELHNPSISAPVKFLVRVLNSSKLTSELNIPFSVNFWYESKISFLPFHQVKKFQFEFQIYRVLIKLYRSNPND